MQLLFFASFYFFSLTGYWVNCDHVPMVLWNLKGSSAPLRAVSAFEVSHDKYTKELLQSTLKDGASMIVFAMDKLSMEDLAYESNKETPVNSLQTLEALLGEDSHVMFPSVKDPMRHFRDVACGVKDIHAGKHSSENLDKLITSALENSCVVIVHLGSKGLPTGIKLSLQTSKENVVGVFTASKSSWHSPEELHRRSRSLFAVEENVTATHFMNYTGCIIMYADEITLKTGKDPDIEIKSLTFPPTIEGNCENNTRSLVLTFSEPDKASEVILTFNFVKRLGAWTTGINLQVNKSEELELRSSTIDVPLSFSFSCGSFSMSAPNASTPTTIIIDRFQIQPFEVNERFSSSFDCVPFFTLPIWMGIFIGILFIIILNTGIYALFNIKTMDRFDDPKGKTISVPVGAE